MVVNEDDRKKVNNTLGRLAMFLLGFVMLMPHRIALSCAPHVVKRFHLPIPTVGLFIYKIHNPMELSSLFGTIIANVVTWVRETTIVSKYLTRYLSIICIWLLFFCSIMTYFLFVTGDEFGYLNYFYWDMIFFTFINGFSSSFAFSVNSNTSMYGAGIPLSGAVTFVVHNIYKGLYNKIYWSDYDYYLVITQLWFTILMLLITCLVWTADQCFQTLQPQYQDYEVMNMLLPANKLEINKLLPSGGGTVEHTAASSAGAQATAKINSMKKISWGNAWIIAGELNSTTKGVAKKLENLGKLWNDSEAVKIGGFVALGIFGFMLMLGVIVGIVRTAFLDLGDLELSNKIRNFGILFVVNSLVPVVGGIFIADYNEKVQLKNSNIELKTNKSNTELTAADIAGLNWANDDPVQKFNKVDDLVRSNFVAALGVGCIIVSFSLVLIFATVLFYISPESNIVPLFLFVFIITHTTGLFLCVILLGFIGTIAVFAKDQSTTDHRLANGIVLFTLFIPIIIYSLRLSKQRSYIIGFVFVVLSYALVAMAVNIGVDQGIKYLFNGDKGMGDWSPIGMLSLSMGTVYAFFPAISPYQLVDDEDIGNDIEKWVLLISSIPTVLIALLDIHWDDRQPVFGPGGKWGDDPNAKPKPRTRAHALWHLTWVFIIPYFSCIVIFFFTIHFPDGKIGKFFLNHNVRTGTLCVFFSTVQETLEAVGFAGGGLQGAFFNGAVSQFNVLLMLTTMVLTMFTCD